MTPAQIKTLRDQTGLPQPRFAERINEIDPLLRIDGSSISRYERDRSHPAPHVVAALTRLWLHEGYPTTSGDLTGILTTNHSASSYGLPVFVADGVAYGSGEIGPITLTDAPASIVEAVTRAGYVVDAGDT